ncbi:MAG: ABC transporter permease [Eubacteriales bacterium]|nr:ABC transporter permease [Eubacteriales bacterium]
MNRRIKLWAGVLIITVITAACVFGPMLAGVSYLDTDILGAYSPPSRAHPLGTDEVGRDVLIRLLFGGRISIFVGLAAGIAEMLISLIVGIVSGLSRKKTDGLLMGISDIVLGLPVICIVLILGSVLADLNVDVFVRAFMTAVVIALFGWPMTARLIRAKVRSLRESDIIKSVQLLGLPKRSVMFRHLLPNLAPQIFSCAAVAASGAVLSEATLSFLGFGISYPHPSWGNMISIVLSKSVLLDKWWVWLPACGAVTLLILSINFIGENLYDKGK